ncbi:hypothetical protein BF29_2840 [Heyndrickxia coagulans DSM 1 = ATCC 7050]|uniref:Uncharacterized protein n=1 Tax=Heyndrickxia coagulans DSM 1 = ATCC 7050 TaxID=1121088 RepID=A0A8B4BVT2_HEYCO|nr:hypothetical protein BF29_2840 [Heyndrickxia coagulans DSM 1 = ATCC 7050]SHF12722.1 hypothetical protein SAMN02745208_01438 [Heyndrickxia coagulans DSM 1 = ATCC 7050]
MQKTASPVSKHFAFDKTLEDWLMSEQDKTVQCGFDARATKDTAGAEG